MKWIFIFICFCMLTGLPERQISFAQGTQTRSYNECIEMANTNPREAIDLAARWRDAGGGVPARHCYGMALVSLGSYPDAALELMAAVETLRAGGTADGLDLDSDSVAALEVSLMAQAGNAYMLANDFAKAYQLFTQALENNGADPSEVLDIYLDRAYAAFDLGDMEAVTEDLIIFLSDRPRNVEARILRAKAYRILGFYNEASGDLAIALGASPDNPEGLLERGQLSYAQGNIEAAKEDWFQVVDVDPDSPAADIARENLLQLAEAELD